MMFSPARRIAVAAALVTTVGLGSMVAAASATGASRPQQRQLAVAALSDFKVVLTATQEPRHPLLAKVTASGFQRSDGQWKLISIKRLGKAFEGDVNVCSLKTIQFKNNTAISPPVIRFDAIRVRLLLGPALGCSRAIISERWTP